MNFHLASLHTSSYCTFYQDFDPYSSFYLSNLEFNWEDQGYYILENICPDLITSTNNEIVNATELTSNTINDGDEVINTFHFRNALKCYAELILGIYNEDFKYGNMNKLLKISNKIFIKNVVCYPSKITKDDLIMLRHTFSYQEIYHLIMIVLFHKSRSQLTFISKCYDEIRKQFD